MPPFKKKFLSPEEIDKKLSELQVSNFSEDDLPPFIKEFAGVQKKEKPLLIPIKKGVNLDLADQQAVDYINGLPDPATITSGFRSLEKNKAVGGVPGSAHTKGRGFDFRLDEMTPRNIQYLKDGGFKVLREDDHYHVESPQAFQKFLSPDEIDIRLKELGIDKNEQILPEQTNVEEQDKPLSFFERLKRTTKNVSLDEAQSALASGLESIGLPSVLPGETPLESIKRQPGQVFFPGAASVYKLADRPGEAVRAGLVGKDVLSQFAGKGERTSGEEVLQKTGVISPETRKQLEQFPEKISQLREEQIADYPDIIKKAIAPGASLTNILPSQLISKGPGLVTEIATDPLTYIGIGNMRKLIKSGKAIGTKVKNIVTNAEDAKGILGNLTNEERGVLATELFRKQQTGKVLTDSENKILNESSKFFSDVKIPTRVTFKNPEVEARFQSSKGITGIPIKEKVKEGIQNFSNKLFRDFEYLPDGPQYAETKFKMRELNRLKEVAGDKTVRNLEEITKGLDNNTYDLFSKKVLMDDLANDFDRGISLPNGLTKENFPAEYKHITDNITPEVERAINLRRQTWDKIRDDYAQAMQDIGVDVSDKLRNKNYFRHQVLEYAKAKSEASKNRIIGGKLKSPTRGAVFQKRGGTSLDINTDYLQAENEVMAQLLHDTNIAKMVKFVDDKHNIQPRLANEARLLKKNWEDIIPEGYSKWQPREGSIYYMTDSIPARVAENLKQDLMSSIGITGNDIKQALAIGGPKKSFVLPNELVKTLNKIPDKPNPLSKVQTAWKQWQLLSPVRTIKYNLRNVTGDVDAVIAGNPGTFKEVPSAMKDLYKLFSGKMDEVSPELMDWYQKGGMGSLLQAQEMGDINSLKRFSKLIDKKGSIAEYPAKLWEKYWKATRMSTDFREAVLRFSAYKNYLKQMRESGGVPKNFGASLREEVMALGNINDRAYKLSNDLLGAYDEIGVIGQGLRKNLLPFYSWKEVNLKRYARLAKNSIEDGKSLEVLGRKLAGSALVKTPYMALKIGSFAAKALALTAGVTAWNKLMYPDEEAQLPENVRSRPHIVLGKDKNGKVIYFDRIGAVMDLGEWFSLDDAPKDINDYVTGRRSLKEIATDMAKAPAKVFAGMVGPQVKLPVEMMIGKSFFPDPLNPRPIRDRGLHIAQGLGLGEEYKQIMGLPTRPYKDRLKDLVTYRIDPGEAAYNDIYGFKKDFYERIEKPAGGSFAPTEMSNALYNMKQAIKFKDGEAGKKYLTEVLTLSQGDFGAVEKAIEKMDPLYGLNKEDEEIFLQSLNKDQMDTLERAYEWYYKNIVNTSYPKLSDSDLNKIVEDVDKRQKKKLKTIEEMISR